MQPPYPAKYIGITKNVNISLLSRSEQHGRLGTGPHFFLPRIGSILQAAEQLSTAKLPQFTTA